MADRGAQHPTYTHTSAPLQPRRGPGAVAWVVLAVFGGVAALLVVAMAAGSYAGTLISALALLALAVPTIILMAVWIEVRVENRRLRRSGPDS